jgi:hypothetical protein
MLPVGAVAIFASAVPWAIIKPPDILKGAALPNAPVLTLPIITPPETVRLLVARILPLIIPPEIVTLEELILPITVPPETVMLAELA